MRNKIEDLKNETSELKTTRNAQQSDRAKTCSEAKNGTSKSDKSRLGQELRHHEMSCPGENYSQNQTSACFEKVQSSSLPIQRLPVHRKYSSHLRPDRKILVEFDWSGVRSGSYGFP